MPCTFIYSKRRSMQKIRTLSLLVPPRIVARPRTKKRDTDRATFVWPWNENARTNRNNKRTEIELFDWFIGGFWLVQRTLGWKNFMPQNLLEINRYLALTYYGFLWRENEEFIPWSFHQLADKTNNEHFPKQFFKVIRKSLYVTQYKLETIKLNRLK